jgi:polygalacturonase
MKQKTIPALIVTGIILFGCTNHVSWEKELVLKLNSLADSLVTNLKEWEVPDHRFEVEDFGAVADGKTMNTHAIQKAIDKCTEEGGGQVLFSKGDYVTGTVVLKSNVMLKIDKGARIIGSIDISDYPHKIETFKSIMSERYEFKQSLIFAEKQENVGICGEGEIYFRGEIEHFPGPETILKIVDRPLGIRMIQCNNVVVKDILLHNSAAWMQNYLYCENLIFDDIEVINLANYNNDGLDIDGCRNVIVRKCNIISGDDAMCFKGASSRITENILIENCTFLTNCNGLKIGTDTQGSFRKMIARKLVLGTVPDTLYSIKGHEASTGITLVTVDGGNVEDIYITDISINRARCPVFLRIGNRGRVMNGVAKPSPGQLKNIVINGVNGEHNFTQGSFISGITGHEIEDIIIRNMHITMTGGGTPEMAQSPVVEDEGGYPDAHEFSINGLPSYGFYIRHAENILLENVQISPQEKDARPAFKSGGNIQCVVINGENFNK